MNKLKNKIAAFTLLELMVTLTLTILIVAMSYFSYNYIFRGFLKYRDINENIEQHCRMQNYFNYLLQRSEKIIKKKDGIDFVMNETDSRKFTVAGNYLLFLNTVDNRDTLKLKITDLKLYWKGDSVLPDNGPVQKIKLNVDFSGKQHSLIFEKPYDSEKLIELDSLDKALR
ncbi:MAG TPA: prepilin-type N-terminal cleavage/methylation domain-containing protein [Bacteroidia bacterium]|nr:prepilin-type N-terminal cleavage/methylation domain-containing protein [Bacteroidia bacterium]